MDKYEVIMSKGSIPYSKINIVVFCQQEPELVFDLRLKYVSVCTVYI